MAARSQAEAAADLDVLLVVGAGVQDGGQGERGQQGQVDAVTSGHCGVGNGDNHDRTWPREVAT